MTFAQDTYEHGTIIRTEKKHVRKSLVIWATQPAGGLLLKRLNYFKVVLNIFEFSRVSENVESWLVFANKLFWIAQPHFLTDIIKRSLHQLSFLAFKTFDEKKQRFL